MSPKYNLSPIYLGWGSPTLAKVFFISLLRADELQAGLAQHL